MGRYANGGAEYQRKGEPGDHTYDFIGVGQGGAVRGVRRGGERGVVNVGTDADTGEFAVESIRRCGPRSVYTYPEATGC